jgi:hypothetical protein
VAVTCTDAAHAWAVGDGSAILATSDGGATWTPQNSGDNTLNAVAFADAGHGCAVGYGGLILVTSDGGATWVARQPVADSTLTGVAFADAQTGWAVGSTGYPYGPVILRTTDGGDTWSSAGPTPPPQKIAPSCVAFADPLHGWIGGDAAQLMDTGDGGATWSSPSLSANEADAQRLSFTSPYWASGRPGSAVKLRLQNYPAGWQLSFTGYAGYPKSAATKSFGAATSTGVYNQARTVTVPRTAKPGYAYWLGVQHKDGTLYLENSFQVCTLNATKTAIAKGTAIRATGVVPVQGHEGSTPGKRTTVYFWVHVGTKGVPTKWDPRSQGWLYLGAVRTNGLGAYRTPLFEPLRTLTLVAQYPGDDKYFGAYTSVRKITVK